MHFAWPPVSDDKMSKERRTAKSGPMKDIHRFAKERIWYRSRKQLLVLAVREAVERRSSPLRFLQSLLLSWEFRTHPEAFYNYRIFQNWRLRGQYIYPDEIVCILPALDRQFAPDDAADLDDKRRFEQRCLAAGLPCVRTLAEFHGGQTRQTIEAPNGDVFVKYHDRWGGEGAAIWHYINGKYQSGQQSLSFPELLEELAAVSANRPILLQPRYRNHPALAEISGHALSTIRVVTVRDGSSVHVCAAVLRTSTGEHVADNFELGGLAAPVDLVTGILTGPATAKDTRKEPNKFERHPIGGGLFTGTAIPLWDQVKKLAIRSHEEFSNMPSVGWDIAVTASNPILVEGNTGWGVDLIQMAHNAPIADGPIPKLLLNFIWNIKTVDRTDEKHGDGAVAPSKHAHGRSG